MIGDLPANAREVVDRWWEELVSHPDRLPAGVEPVQTRLIRSVGRASLVGVGSVFVKAMGFPRGRDRLRYALRALPALHEAALLVEAARRDVRCPRVVAARGCRRGGLPHASLLVTAALDVADDPTVGLRRRAELARSLAEAGLVHRDLNPGNCVRLRDGSVAVLDLQSARLRRGPLRGPDRRRMAVKILAAGDGPPSALVDAGLCSAAELSLVQAAAAALRVREIRGRVLRCLATSSEFHRVRTWRGVWHRRRAFDGEELEPVGHGRMARRLWVGDRARQVLDGAPPLLSAWFVSSWWLPGASSVYTPAAIGQESVAASRDELFDAYRRFETLAEDPAVAGDRPA